MEKITKREFIEILNNHPSILAGSFFRRNDDEIIKAMENCKGISEKAKRRTVTENHSNYIVFSNGSRLDFNQKGKNEYFRHKSGNGIEFILQRLTTETEDFDAEEDYYNEHGNFNCGSIFREDQNYVIYAIVEQHKEENSAVMEKKETFEHSEKVNPICLNCEKFGGECKGTYNKVWTGCVYRTRKFELFFGCLGNGITVCNKAVIECGDYKHIAHISEGGNIQMWVSESHVPAEAMEKIREEAKRMAAEFKKRFESLPEVEQYGKIIDRVPHEKFIRYAADKRPLAEKLPAMREYYYKIV